MPENLRNNTAQKERVKWQPPKGFYWVYLALAMSMLLAALDQTIVSTSLPTIVGELDGVQYMGWVVTAYIFAATISMPIYGKMGDVAGRRTVFLIAQILFIAGSIFAGLSQSIFQLVGARVLQGLGGGGLFVLSITVVAALVPARERAKYTTPISAIFILASILGPLVGGYFTDYLSWRWIFWINIPLGGIALIITWFALNTPKQFGDFKLDVWGIILMILALTCMTLMISWGGSRYEWISLETALLLSGFVLFSILFGIVEQKATDPIIPLHLFTNYTFVIATLIGLFIGIAMFGTIGFMPTYLQMVYGQSAILSGYTVTLVIVGVIITITISGFIVEKTGKYKSLIILGCILVAASLYLLSTIKPDQSIWTICIYFLLMGFGFGAMMQTLVIIAQESVVKQLIGTVTSVNSFFREIGATIGIAVVGGVFSVQLQTALSLNLPSNENAELLDSASITPAILRGLSTQLREAYIASYASSLPNIYLYLVPLFVVGLILTLFMKQDFLD